MLPFSRQRKVLAPCLASVLILLHLPPCCSPSPFPLSFRHFQNVLPHSHAMLVHPVERSVEKKLYKCCVYFVCYLSAILYFLILLGTSIAAAAVLFL